MTSCCNWSVKDLWIQHVGITQVFMNCTMSGKNKNINIIPLPLPVVFFGVSTSTSGCKSHDSCDAKKSISNCSFAKYTNSLELICFHNSSLHNFMGNRNTVSDTLDAFERRTLSDLHFHSSFEPINSVSTTVAVCLLRQLQCFLFPCIWLILRWPIISQPSIVNKVTESHVAG